MGFSVNLPVLAFALVVALVLAGVRAARYFTGRRKRQDDLAMRWAARQWGRRKRGIGL